MASLRSFPLMGLVLALSGCGGADATTEGDSDPGVGVGGGGGGAAAGSPGVGGSSAGAAGTPSSGGSGGTRLGGGGSGSGSAGTTPVDPEPEFPDATWPVGDPVDQGLDPVKLEEAAKVAEQIGSYCWLVIRNGKLVAERYWNGHDATTPEKSWSIAKSYSATLVGIAVARGDIKSLDQSVSDYIPEWKGTPREAITFKHVISMTSGLEWSAFDDYFVMATLAPDHSEHAISRKLAKTPGSEWIYNNAGVQILEPALRAATGKTIEEYAELHLWSKIGTKATWAHDPAGHPTAYASVLASCRDHARLGYLYMHGGRWKTEQVVPADFVASALTPSQNLNRAYGYLWWLNGETPAMDAMMEPWPGMMVPFAPPDHFAARGFGNQFVDVFPNLDMMVIRFGPDPLVGFDLVALMNDQKFEKHDKMLKPVLEAVVK